MKNREGRILRERRRELGMTQEEVAIELHMSIHQYQWYIPPLRNRHADRSAHLHDAGVRPV